MTDSAALQRIKQKYVGNSSTSASDFDKTSSRSSRSSRVSEVPTLANAKEYDLEEHAKLMTRLNGEMVDLANDYEKLNADFRNTSLRGRDTFYSLPEAVAYNFFKATRQRGKMRNFQETAIGKKARRLVNVTDAIAEIFEDNYQTAGQGRQHMQDILVANLAHRKGLEEKIIGTLRESYQNTPEQFAVEEELSKMEKELGELDKELQRYERLVDTAKAKDDVKRVEELTTEMLQVLDIKYGVLEGRMGLQNADRELRMRLVDYAEGVQSARNALEMAYANSEQITNMIDVFWKTEIKYKHARNDVIPLFREQARIATEAETSQELIATYQKAAAISSELMKANAILVGNMVKGVMQLLTMTFYDPEVSRQSREQLNRIVDQARKEEDRWAAEVLRVVPQASGYASQR